MTVTRCVLRDLPVIYMNLNECFTHIYVFGLFTGVQEKLGILNNGVVYAVFDYQAQSSDELDFSIGDEIVVLRKGDEVEKEWWWSRLRNKEGYIPRNLLGLYPRVLPQSREDSDS
ncbi:hypothetical protein KUTeg_013040 [Tegillarca granosa]|uniref:SH3 domain-containing protein n=1 Tax=Tegillarca granosa TaxID=220873 RepID=A0ABQ9ESI5_TEGGR|nr:hypothetical protein KUTeg_013040 [Tegillarca granosa]